jgi:hypothetical protein
MSIVRSGLINGSALIDTNSTEVFEQNSGRCYLLIVNTDPAIDVWLNPSGGLAGDPAADADARGSFKLAADGGYYEMVGPYVNTSAITAVAASGDVELTAYEA